MAWKYIGVVFLLALSTSAFSQDTTEAPASVLESSDVIGYEVNTGNLVSIDADGMHVLTNLPEVRAFTGPYQPGLINNEFSLSPDRSKLVFLLHPETPGTSKVYYVADVNTGACCQKLDPQSDEQPITYREKPVFSPDGTQVAISYESSDGASSVPEIVVFDLATAQVVGRLSASAVADYTSLDNAFLVYDWTDEGITVYAEYCCQTNGPQGNMQVWVPGEALPQPTLIPRPTANLSLSTDESLQMGYRDGYTAQPITQNISSPSNVVLYTPAGQTDSYVIFQDEYYPEILSARWVADGNAVLLFVNNVDFESESMLLTRSGLILSQVSDSNFVAATVDGWLTNSFDTISYYQFDGERITLSYIEEPTGYVAIVATPALGSSLVDAPAFPEIEAP